MRKLNNPSCFAKVPRTFYEATGSHANFKTKRDWKGIALEVLTGGLLFVIALMLAEGLIN